MPNTLQPLGAVELPFRLKLDWLEPTQGGAPQQQPQNSPLSQPLAPALTLDPVERPNLDSSASWRFQLDVGAFGQPALANYRLLFGKLSGEPSSASPQPTAVVGASLGLSSQRTQKREKNEWIQELNLQTSAALLANGVDAAYQQVVQPAAALWILQAGNEELMAQIESELAYLNGPKLRELVSMSPSDPRYPTLAAEVLAHLLATRLLMSAMRGLAGSAADAADVLETAHPTLSGRGTATGFGKLSFGWRREFTSDAGTLNAELKGAGVIPLPNPNPDAASAGLPGLRPSPTLMVQGEGVVKVGTQNFVTLADWFRSLEEVGTDALMLIDDVIAVARGDSNLSVDELETRMSEVQGRYDDLVAEQSNVQETLQLNVQNGWRITEALLPGVVFDRAALSFGHQFSFDRSERGQGESNGRPFVLSTKAVVAAENFLGFLPGRVTNYAVLTNSSGANSLQELSSKRGNVKADFFPAQLGVGLSAQTSLREHLAISVGAGAQAFEGGWQQDYALSLDIGRASLTPMLSKPSKQPANYSLSTQFAWGSISLGARLGISPLATSVEEGTRAIWSASTEVAWTPR